MGTYEPPAADAVGWSRTATRGGLSVWCLCQRARETQKVVEDFTLARAFGEVIGVFNFISNKSKGGMPSRATIFKFCWFHKEHSEHSSTKVFTYFSQNE